MSFSGLMFFRVPVAVLRRRVTGAVVLVDDVGDEPRVGAVMESEGRVAGEQYTQAGFMTSVSGMGGISYKSPGSSGNSAVFVLIEGGADVKRSSAAKRGRSDSRAGLLNSSSPKVSKRGVLRKSEYGVSLGDDSKSCAGVCNTGDVRNSWN